jgi:arabinofuranan 3-O-arabinosyltransferase
MRLLAICVLLTAAVFQQEPGRLAPDTKLDLVVDPLRFLDRAIHLWEPLGFFGQVQNQAYGYLFPMGPFFAAGHVLALPPWAVQRLWVSVLVCVAFLGTVRLARLIGIEAAGARVVAGLAYALAPRMITVLGAASIEALPVALAPWVLVPLVAGAVRGSPRRAAAWSGVAILCAGGVNAAATIAVLPLPALWLLTRQPGPRRRQLMLWWSGAVALATFWWVVPLLLLGRYSPPFLDFIESARTTTIPTNLTEVVRGTSHWLAYLLADDGTPVWRAGWLLVTTPVLILDTVVLSAAGLVAVARRDMPERTWAVLGLLTGVLLVGLGHASSTQGLFAGEIAGLLDGVLAPLRNVHKFDPVLRLPLALALAHLLVVLRSRIRGSPGIVVRIAVYASVAAVLAGCAAPLLLNRLIPRGDYAAVPGYWRETADFLATEGGADRALLVPASRFGTYYWGDPRDEPLQPLARSTWGVRDAVPLAQPGNIRMLDAIEQRLATGRGSPGLAAFVARAGIGHIVVRNDLDYARADAPRPVLVHQALNQSPGFRRVATFGPFVGGGAGRSDLVVDQQLDRPYPAVEIFEVTPPGNRVDVYRLADVPVVSGGPESLLELTDRGWLGRQPAILSVDRPRGLAAGPAVVTDGFRRREVTFGRIEDNASAVMTADQPRRLGGTARDYLPASVAHVDKKTGAPTETVARLEGGSELAASSSSSDADAFGATRPEHQPFSAFDGEEGTSWISGGVGGAVGEWLELLLTRAEKVDRISLLIDPDAPGARVTRVRVTTDQGHVDLDVAEGEGPVSVSVPAGLTRRVRVSALEVEGEGRGFTFGISEIQIPGVRLSRPLVTPPQTQQPSSPPRIALDAADKRRPGCVFVGQRPLCATGLAQPGEEDRGLDRIVELEVGGSYDVTMSAQPRAGTALTELLAEDQPGIAATASSTAVLDPAGSARSTVDRDLGTGWVAGPGDREPTLILRLPERRPVTGVQIVVDPALAASSPRRVRVGTGTGPLRAGTLDGSGTFSFPVLDTDMLTIQFLDVTANSSYDPYTRSTAFMPVGASEVRIFGADDLRRSPASGDRSQACGSGPTLLVNGVEVATRVSASTAELRTLSRVAVQACTERPIELVAGDNRITTRADELWSPVSISLTPAGATTSPPKEVPATVTRWGRTERTLEVPRRVEPVLIAVHENQNDGWSARSGGQELRRVTVDGWQQGWLLPAGPATEVTLRYGPDRPYRMGLGVGALAVVALSALAAWPSRRTRSPGGVQARVLGLLWRASVVSVVFLLVGGPVGLLLAVALTAAALRWPKHLGTGLPLLAGAGMVGAALLLAADPWSSSTYAGDAWSTQVLAMLGLAAVGAAWTVDGPRPTRFLARKARRSTST